jgi:hypothetical protein
MMSLMVALMDFNFHHSFLIISALFTTSVLAIFYSHLFALALMVYRERVAPNGGEVCQWWRRSRNRAHGLEEEDIWFTNATVGCKWGMATLRLFISLTVSFHLSEILGRRA